MATELRKEPLVGKLDRISPPTLLPPGSITDGLNMRKVGIYGGWKPRKGCTLINTSASPASESTIWSIHQYSHPQNEDYHLITQTDNALYDNQTPLTQGATIGTGLGVTVGDTAAGFSAIVGDYFVFAAAGKTPVAYGGTYPFCKAFIAYDSDSGYHSDYTSTVTNNEDILYERIDHDTSDVFYVCAHEPISGIKFKGVTYNSSAATTTVYAMRGGTWTAVSGFSDGTASGGATFGQDGTMTWTASSSDKPSIFEGIHGYWYKLAPSASLSVIDIISIKVVQACNDITTKWDGTWEDVTGCFFYDQSAAAGSKYVDNLTNVTDGTTTNYLDLGSMTTADYIYIKTPEPAMGFWFGMVPGQVNGNAANVVVEYCAQFTSNWPNCSAVFDETANLTGDCFEQTGAISWDHTTTIPAVADLRDVFIDDSDSIHDTVPGYWYRISVDAALDANGQIYSIQYAPYSDKMEYYDGVVEFQNRAFFWGGRYGNKLFYTVKDSHDECTGSDSGWTNSFGDNSPVKCAVKWYDDLVVFKEKGMYLLSGASPSAYTILPISEQIGIASPKSALVIEDHFPSASQDDPLSIVIWQAVDGVYVLDKQLPRKVSAPIDNYFNPEYSDCISASYINSMCAFWDKNNREYHLCHGSTKELVYNYRTDEWYTPFDRYLDLQTGSAIIGTDGRQYTVGGRYGLLMLLEQGTTDRNAANMETTITHWLKTRAIGSHQEAGVGVSIKLYDVWVETKAAAAGTMTVTFYEDQETAGTAISGQTLIRSGYNLVVPHVRNKTGPMACFELRLQISATAGGTLEIYSILYTIEQERELPKS